MEVLVDDVPSMRKEAEILAVIADNVCIKLLLPLEGLKACKQLSAYE